MTTYARSEVSRDGESGGETPSMAGLLNIHLLAVVVVVVVVVIVVVVVVVVVVVFVVWSSLLQTTAATTPRTEEGEARPK